MSHLNARMPTGNDVTQRSDLKPAFSHDLLERVLQRNNLHTAWQRVRANKGAAGIDGISIDEFPAWAKAGHWKRVGISPHRSDEWRSKSLMAELANWGSLPLLIG